MDGSFIILFLLTVFLVAIVYYNIKKLFDQPEDKKFTKSESCSYFAKRLPMTQPEVDFFSNSIEWLVSGITFFHKFIYLQFLTTR